MRYYIADLHFFHNTLNTKMDCRGFASFEEMNRYMIEQWNGRVRSCDEVVILGDLSVGKAKDTNEIAKQLNGTLYLIEGNHDQYIQRSEFKKERFKWIKPYAELYDHKRKVILCHYPIICYNGQYRMDEKGNPKTYMLHGHVHDTFDQLLVKRFQKETRESKREIFGKGESNIPCNMINCFCMYSDYVPLSLDEWIVRNEDLKNENKIE